MGNVVRSDNWVGDKTSLEGKSNRGCTDPAGTPPAQKETRKVGRITKKFFKEGHKII